MAMTIDKLASQMAVKPYDFDPDGVAAVDVAWVDMRDYQNFMCIFMRTIGTSALDTFKILANPNSDGSGTDVTIATHAVGSEPDAVGDYLILECTREQIADAGADLRYVSASCEFATGTDEGVVVYIRANAIRPQDGLTADSVA